MSSWSYGYMDMYYVQSHARKKKTLAVAAASKLPRLGGFLKPKLVSASPSRSPNE